MALLEVRDLRVGFDGEDGSSSRAVDGVSLSVDRGRDARHRRRVGLAARA